VVFKRVEEAETVRTGFCDLWQVTPQVKERQPGDTLVSPLMEFTLSIFIHFSVSFFGSPK
jgi:hypothetical protein